MSIKVVCTCGAKFAAREELAGKSVECTACGKRVQVPHPVAAGTGGAGKGRLMTGMLALGAAVAACGFMIYTQQQRLADLQQQLVAEQARVDAVRQDLDANKAADVEVSAEVEKEKERLTAEAKKQEALLENLDKLDMESVRIRNDISRVEEERRRLSAETENKRAAYDRQIQDLQTDLAKKTSAQETAKINDEIRKIQDAKATLAREAEANRSKIATYDGELRVLQGKLREKLVEQKKLSDQVVEVEKKLTTFGKRANPDTLLKYIKTLWGQAQKNRSPIFKTVAGEDRRFAMRAWFRLDTRTGRVFYKYHTTRGMIGDGPGMSFTGGGQAAGGKPGRFDVMITLDAAGDLGELIRLDTETGRVSYTPLTRRTNLYWREVWVMKPGWNRQTALNPRWTLSVDRYRPGTSRRNLPALVLTAPSGLVYDDSRSLRTWLLPNP